MQAYNLSNRGPHASDSSLRHRGSGAPAGARDHAGARPGDGRADPARWHYGPDFDPARARAQHAALADIVAASGAEVVWLDSGDDGLSDAVFVQDPSFVTRAGAVILNMGKALRRAEPGLHEAAYTRLGVPVIGRLSGDARAEAGDAFWIDPQTLAVGRGARTNQAGIAALGDILRPHGMTVRSYDLPWWTGPDACLHLMSLISPIAPKAALIHAPLMPFALWQDLTDAGWTLIHAPERGVSRLERAQPERADARTLRRGDDRRLSPHARRARTGRMPGSDVCGRCAVHRLRGRADLPDPARAARGDFMMRPAGLSAVRAKRRAARR